MTTSPSHHRPPRRARATSTASLLLLAAVGALGLTGCAASASAADDLPATIAADQILLFRHASDHLVLFDTASHEIAVETTRPQLFHYGFPTRQPLFTSGDSIDNGFRILRVDGAQISTVLLAESNHGLFPLASDGSNFLFTNVTYAGAGGPIVRARISRLEGSTLVDYTNVDDAVTAGVIVDGMLFYTVHRFETGLFDLFRLAVADTDGIPELVDSGLTEGDVYSSRGVVIANDYYGPLDTELNCDYYCYFDDEHGLLLTLYPNTSQDLSLDAIDLTSGERRWTRSGDIVDFTIDGDDLTVYALGTAPQVIDLDGAGR